MENAIIIAIIVITAAGALRYAVRHQKGRGGCCSGREYRPRRKKLPKVICRKIFLIGGMHCEHCRNRVEEAVNDISGAAGRVNLKKGELKVFYSEHIDDSDIVSRIEKAGYTVTGIKDRQKGYKE